MTDESVYKVASGRRRYNARRQALADLRRQRVGAIISQNPMLAITRGFPGTLAALLGVHRSTAWRDIQRAVWGPYRCEHTLGGELLFTVVRSYKGGPVVTIIMDDGTYVTSRREQREILHRWGVGRYNSTKR